MALARGLLLMIPRVSVFSKAIDYKRKLNRVWAVAAGADEGERVLSDHRLGVESFLFTTWPPLQGAPKFLRDRQKLAPSADSAHSTLRDILQADIVANTF
jgi:hypothetical protein